MKRVLLVSGVLLLGVFQFSYAQDAETEKPTPEQQLPEETTPEINPKINKGMNNAQMDALIKRLDPNVKGTPGNWLATIEGLQVRIVTDNKADRMRIMVPVMQTGNLNEEVMYRLMQANFESALDARYAVAQNILWSTYIHPLSPLTDKQFLSGVGQTLSLVKTFGTTFSSGALTFGGGDNSSNNKKNVHDRIIEKGQAI